MNDLKKYLKYNFSNKELKNFARGTATLDCVIYNHFETSINTIIQKYIHKYGTYRKRYEKYNDIKSIRLWFATQKSARELLC